MKTKELTQFNNLMMIVNNLAIHKLMNNQQIFSNIRNKMMKTQILVVLSDLS